VTDASVYRHKRTQKRYYRTDDVKIKTASGDWVDGIAYVPYVKLSPVYVRPTADFDDAFELVENNEDDS